MQRTCAWYDLCGHQMFVIMGLTFHTLQPGVKLFICLSTKRQKFTVRLKYIHICKIKHEK